MNLKKFNRVLLTILSLVITMQFLSAYSKNFGITDKTAGHNSTFEISDFYWYFTALNPETSINPDVIFSSGLGNDDNYNQRDQITYSENGTVNTRDGTEVTVYEASRDLTNQEISAYNSYISTYFPNISTLSGPSSRYNCHSYAWHEQSTSNTKWINDYYGYGDVYEYVNDLHSEILTTPVVGCKVVYFDSDNKICHSGIVTAISGTSITVKSKWGKMGLYSHLMNDVPSDYQNTPTQVLCVFIKYNDHSNTLSYDQHKHYYTCSYCDYVQSGYHSFLPYGGTRRCRICGYIEGIGPIDLCE